MTTITGDDAAAVTAASGFQCGVTVAAGGGRSASGGTDCQWSDKRVQRPTTGERCVHGIITGASATGNSRLLQLVADPIQSTGSRFCRRFPNNFRRRSSRRRGGRGNSSDVRCCSVPVAAQRSSSSSSKAEAEATASNNDVTLPVQQLVVSFIEKGERSVCGTAT